MAARAQPRAVHLVGSVPLPDDEAVFRTASELLGARLKRLPDGETGERASWIGWQAAVFARTPALERVPASGADDGRRARYRLGPGAGKVTFGGLGYADAALASFATFGHLKG